jgi:hypothetical protein
MRERPLSFAIALMWIAFSPALKPSGGLSRHFKRTASKLGRSRSRRRNGFRSVRAIVGAQWNASFLGGGRIERAFNERLRRRPE